ncbi:MAG: beta-galactosidase [Anaerolineae bacterium]|nr:beta-galactosidase [Anaerolineae bacterium]
MITHPRVVHVTSRASAVLLLCVLIIAAIPVLHTSATAEWTFQVGMVVEPNPDPNVYRIWTGEVRDRLNLRWIKQYVRWDEVEPTQGEYDWSTLDVPLQVAQEYGVQVLLTISTAPDWSRDASTLSPYRTGPPIDPQRYADFLGVLLERYPDQIHAIEVWSQMNLDRHWSSTQGLSAEEYVALLAAAYDAIKAADPDIIVISGAPSPTGWNDGVMAYDDFVYLDMLIDAGMLDTTDCMGAHHNGYNIGPSVPWNQVPNDPTATFRGPFDNWHHSWSFHSTLKGYALRIWEAGYRTPLCVTEFGWATTEDLDGTPRGFEFANDNTLAEQGQFIGEAIGLMEQWDFVWLAFVWNLNYGAQAGWDASNDNVPYSLLRLEWHPAPAYEAIAAFDFRSR